MPEVETEYFIKTTEGFIFGISENEAEKIIPSLEEGASGLLGQVFVQEYILGEGNILFYEEKEILTD